MRKSMFILFLLGSMFIHLNAQQKYTSGNKKAIKKLEQAMQFFHLKQYKESIAFLNDVIRIDSGFIEPYLILAEAYIETGKIEAGVEAYKKGIAINPSFFPNALYDLAVYEYALGRYDDASGHVNTFLANPRISIKLREKANKLASKLEFALYAIAHPVPFNPVNLGDSINSEYDEYWPSISADKKTFVITRLLPADNPGPYDLKYQEDFYVSTLMNDKWSKAQPMGRVINTPTDNEGAQSLTVDGKAMFYTGCNLDRGMGLCDIYFSFYDSTWRYPMNIGASINSKYSEKQPSISPDGNYLYFASNREGTLGGLDLWVAEFNGMGYWNEPVNLGDLINTPNGNESAPFIHADGKTLYFASDGHPGMGGIDLYVTFKDDEGNWTTPKNLGYPINTHNNEEGIIVNSTADIAYYASNREEGKGRDIFMFELPDTVRPTPVSYMKGIVYDITNKLPLLARFELIDLKTGNKIMQSWSNSKRGDFMITIPARSHYALNVSREGYLFYSEHFTLEEEKSYADPFLIDVPLQPIVVGKKLVLKNIFFSHDSYQLLPESMVELSKLIKFLNDNPSLVVEIGGHTDNTGADDYNQKLSEDRAKSVVDYLKTQQIQSSRLKYKGYGESEPISTNETPEGRALNRRTEMKVVGK